MRTSTKVAFWVTPCVVVVVSGWIISCVFVRSARDKQRSVLYPLFASRYADQLDRLREAAFQISSSDGRSPGQWEHDQRLFASVIEAAVKVSDETWIVLGGSGLEYDRGKAYFPLRPRIGYPVVNIFTYTAGNGRVQRVAVYRELVRNPAGQVREFEVKVSADSVERAD
jgi:hypothetical protein